MTSKAKREAIPGWGTRPKSIQHRNLEQLLTCIPDKRSAVVARIYNDHHDLFHTNPGSSHNHQTWVGGLADHYADLLRLSWLEYDLLQRFRGPLPFALGSAQVALFCHDAEKVVVYGPPDDPRCAKYHALSANGAGKTEKEKIKWVVLDDWCRDYGLELTEAELNAVKYTHGEGDDYRFDRRVMNELAAFVGNIDRTSARIFYDSGRDLG